MYSQTPGLSLEQFPGFTFFEAPFGHQRASVLPVTTCPWLHSLLQPDWTSAPGCLSGIPSNLCLTAWDTLCHRPPPGHPLPPAANWRSHVSSEKPSRRLPANARPGHLLALRGPSHAGLLPPGPSQTLQPHVSILNLTASPRQQGHRPPSTAPGTQQVISKYCLTNVRPANRCPSEAGTVPPAGDPRRER